MECAKPIALGLWRAAARRLGAVALVLCATLHPVAAAVPEAEEKKVGPPSVVQRLLDTPYLTDAERADIRVRHGIWTEQDLQDAARRARAAVVRGAWDDPAKR